MLLVWYLVALVGASNPSSVREHCDVQGNLTFKEPSGKLKYKYLVPGGFYDQLWDWDSYFMGVALLDFGSAPYLEGSMMNFLDGVNSSGYVQGCLLPSGATGTIYHAKPIVIQAAWIATKTTGGSAKFRPFGQQMKDLLAYWDRTRRDKETGLYVWFDQLESGEDNLVISTCHSARSDCWNATEHALVISAPDLMTFLHREYDAYSHFNAAWVTQLDSEIETLLRSTEHERDPEETSVSLAKLRVLRAEYLSESRRGLRTAEEIKESLNKWLWSDTLGFYTAYNLSRSGAQHVVDNRVSIMGFPLWAGLATKDQAGKLLANLWKDDMLSEWGVRSASSADPRYTNANIIKPYSNWAGPIWVNANAVLSYGLMRYNYTAEAKLLADRVVKMLGADLSSSKTWHESYNSDNGSALAAPGFLSWDTLGCNWQEQLAKGQDPFAL